MIYHLVDPRPTTDERILRARQSWEVLYAGGKVRQRVIDKTRTAREIGDKRDLPYLKVALTVPWLSLDTVWMLTNDDVILEPEIVAVLTSRMKVQGACSSFRMNLPAKMTDYGRDLFAFTGQWLQAQCVPDMFLGEAEWDICMARMVRKSIGCRLDSLQVPTQAELPIGLVKHESHQSDWQKPENKNSPAKIWNALQARQWYSRMGLGMFCTV